jgi:predicted SprT family Zn-dependent metalloprotease
MTIKSRDISKFGKLTIIKLTNMTIGSHKKILCKCDCGKKKLVQINSLFSGFTQSCGQCNQITAEEIATRKFGKLQIKIPQSINPGSAKKIEWTCNCGREKLIEINKVISGHTTSCGLCNQILSEEISTKKFGKLRIKIQQDILPGSNKKIEWICDCGKEKLIRIYKVLSGHTTSCGLCNLIPAAEIALKKFGKLRIKIPQDILPGSTKKVEWICDCGKEKLIRIQEVLLNHITSCGNCSELVKNWYIHNREQIRTLKCPTDTKKFPLGGMIPLEIIQKTGKSFKAICPAYKKEYRPRLDGIKQGKSLTCGCTSYRISMPVIQITEYIQSIGFEVQNEFKVNKLAYDIFIPKKNLLIEFQGTRWHSSEKSKERDLRKKQNAINNGYQFIEILENDWNTKKDKIKNDLRFEM